MYHLIDREGIFLLNQTVITFVLCHLIEWFVHPFVAGGYGGCGGCVFIGVVMDDDGSSSSVSLSDASTFQLIRKIVESNRDYICAVASVFLLLLSGALFFNSSKRQQ